MKIYIAICQDRHIDTVVRVFDDLEKAISYAKSFVKDCSNFPEDIKEFNVDGWLYHCAYSCEGDFVRVEEGELNHQ
jgi:hypothetical protein